MLGLFLVLGSGLGLCSANSHPVSFDGLLFFTWNNIFYFQYNVAPFAPANDDAWLDYMYYQSLGGTPVESQNSLVNAYDDDAGSFNQWMLTGGADGGMAVTTGEYQKYTQHSNPGAQYLAYDLFSGGGADTRLGSTLFQPNNNFWMPQLMNAMNRVPGSPIDNSMLRQYIFMLNNLPSRPIDPWANYYAYQTAQQAYPIPAPTPDPAMGVSRKRRSAGPDGQDKKKRKRRAANRKRRSAGRR